MKKLFSLIAVFVLPFSTLFASTATAETSSELSDRGNQSVKQLAACIQTANSLDVYYVVDMSTSLEDTDPNKMRADILAEDVSRWGDVAELTSGLKVRINGTFFAGSTESFSGGWQEVNGKNKTDVAKKIGEDVRNHPLQNYTNWLSALKVAEKNLASSQAQCKAVVWFTDGGLWIGEGHSGNTNALSELCGVKVPTTGALPKQTSKTGLLQKLRDENVSIFGVLLNSAAGSNAAEEAYWRSYMQTLVEESGPAIGSYEKLPSGEFVCGKNLNGKELNYPSGAFLQADSPSKVAYPFLLITSQVAGGYLTDIDTNGNFWIDPAFKSFEILTLDPDWKITDSHGQVIKSSSDLHGVATTGRIPFTIAEPEQWHFAGQGKLVLYPEISPELDPKTIFTGKDAQISGHFVDARTNQIASLKLYKDAKFEASVDGNEKPVKFNKNTGVYSFASGQIASDSVRFAFALTLSTEHYSNIGPINFLITETAQNPAGFPTVSPIKFSKKLENGGDSISAAIIVKGPEDTSAGDGVVCFDSAKITGDDQDELGAYVSRADTWKASFSPDECVTVAAGNVQTVKLTISNSVPKTAHVTGVTNFSLSSAANTGITLEDSRQFEFETGKYVIDFAKIIGLFVLAYLLSVGIPLVILYFLNRTAAKMSHGNEILRASFPVELDTVNRVAQSTQGKALNSADIGMDEFKYRPPQDAALNFEDNEAGTLKAVVPIFPLTAPWYEVVSKEGNTVVTGRIAPRGRQSRYANGRKASFDGHLGKLWMLVIPTASLLATTDENPKTNARLVVYGKTNKGVAPKFPELMANAASQLSILPVNFFNEIKNSLRAESAKPQKANGRSAGERGSAALPKSAGKVPPPPPAPGASAPVPPRPPASSGSAMPPASSGPGGASSNNPIKPARRPDVPPLRR